MKKFLSRFLVVAILVTSIQVAIIPFPVSASATTQKYYRVEAEADNTTAGNGTVLTNYVSADTTASYTATMQTGAGSYSNGRGLLFGSTAGFAAYTAAYVQFTAQGNGTSLTIGYCKHYTLDTNSATYGVFLNGSGTATTTFTFARSTNTGWASNMKVNVPFNFSSGDVIRIRPTTAYPGASMADVMMDYFLYQDTTSNGAVFEAESATVATSPATGRFNLAAPSVYTYVVPTTGAASVSVTASNNGAVQNCYMPGDGFQFTNTVNGNKISFAVATAYAGNSVDIYVNSIKVTTSPILLTNGNWNNYINYTYTYPVINGDLIRIVKADSSYQTMTFDYAQVYGTPDLTPPVITPTEVSGNYAITEAESCTIYSPGANKPQIFADTAASGRFSVTNLSGEAPNSYVQFTANKTGTRFGIVGAFAGPSNTFKLTVNGVFIRNLRPNINGQWQGWDGTNGNYSSTTAKINNFDAFTLTMFDGVNINFGDVVRISSATTSDYANIDYFVICTNSSYNRYEAENSLIPSDSARVINVFASGSALSDSRTTAVGWFGDQATDYISFIAKEDANVLNINYSSTTTGVFNIFKNGVDTTKTFTATSTTSLNLFSIASINLDVNKNDIITIKGKPFAVGNDLVHIDWFELSGTPAVAGANNTIIEAEDCNINSITGSTNITREESPFSFASFNPIRAASRIATTAWFGSVVNDSIAIIAPVSGTSFSFSYGVWNSKNVKVLKNGVETVSSLTLTAAQNTNAFIATVNMSYNVGDKIEVVTTITSNATKDWNWNFVFFDYFSFPTDSIKTIIAEAESFNTNGTVNATNGSGIKNVGGAAGFTNNQFVNFTAPMDISKLILTYDANQANSKLSLSVDGTFVKTINVVGNGSYGATEGSVATDVHISKGQVIKIGYDANSSAGGASSYNVDTIIFRYDATYEATYNATLAKVVNVEALLNQTDLNNARMDVDLLLNATDIAALGARLDAAQILINNYSAVLVSTTAAVVTAETSKLQADVDTARALVAELRVSDRTALNDRLDVVQAYIEAQYALQLQTATAAVVTAETSFLQADKDSATTLVNALRTADKTALTTRLAAVQVEINYNASVVSVTATVNAAAVSKLPADIYSARIQVLGLRAANRAALDAILDTAEGSQKIEAEDATLVDCTALDRPSVNHYFYSGNRYVGDFGEGPATTDSVSFTAGISANYLEIMVGSDIYPTISLPLTELIDIYVNNTFIKTASIYFDQSSRYEVVSHIEQLNISVNDVIKLKVNATSFNKVILDYFRLYKNAPTRYEMENFVTSSAATASTSVFIKDSAGSIASNGLVMAYVGDEAVDYAQTIINSDISSFSLRYRTFDTNSIKLELWKNSLFVEEITLTGSLNWTTLTVNAAFAKGDTLKFKASTANLISSGGRAAYFYMDYIDVVPSSGIVTSTMYQISNKKYISNVAVNTTIDALLADLTPENGSTIEVRQANGTIINAESYATTKAGTGVKIDVLVGASVKNSYSVIIFGDVTGDALINIADLAAIKLHILNSSTLSGDKFKAGDLSVNNKISISSLLAVKKHILSIAFIDQNKAPFFQ